MLNTLDEYFGKFEGVCVGSCKFIESFFEPVLRCSGVSRSVENISTKCVCCYIPIRFSCWVTDAMTIIHNA